MAVGGRTVGHTVGCWWRTVGHTVECGGPAVGHTVECVGIHSRSYSGRTEGGGESKSYCLGERAGPVVGRPADSVRMAMGYGGDVRKAHIR